MAYSYAELKMEDIPMAATLATARYSGEPVVSVNSSGREKSIWEAGAGRGCLPGSSVFLELEWLIITGEDYV